MKVSAVTLALASLIVSASAFSHDANTSRESNVQAQFFNVAVATRALDRDTKQENLAQKENWAKRNETGNTQPDAALVPYVNGGYYDSK